MYLAEQQSFVHYFGSGGHILTHQCPKTKKNLSDSLFRFWKNIAINKIEISQVNDLNMFIKYESDLAHCWENVHR